MASGLQSLKSATQGLALTSVVNQLERLPAIMSHLNSVDVNKFADSMNKLKASIGPLNELTKATGLQSFMLQFKKLPGLAREFESVDMSKFVTQIERMAKAIRPLANEMEKIGNAFTKLPSKMKSLISATDKLTSSKEKYSKKISRAGVSTRGFSFSIGGLTSKLIASYVIVNRITNAIGGFVTKANDYVENINLFNVSLGKYAEEAGKYAQQVERLAGIDSSEFMRNQGIFMSVAKGFGVAEESAYKMSKALTETAYDAMSLFNATNTDEAFNKFKSGLAGELEPLRAWGYALDQATLQQVALNNGITKTFHSMTQGEKAQIRYMAIMEQSARMGVFNDLAHQIHTPANALRILRSQFGVLARTIGQVFIPMLMAIIPYVQAVTTVLIQLFQFLGKLVGYKQPEIKGISSPAVSSIEDAGEAFDNMGGAVGGANKKLKEQKKLLAGFDRLNVLDEQKDSSPSGGGGGRGGVGGAGGLGMEWDLPDRPDFLDGLVEDSALVTSIKNAFKSMKDAIQPFIDTIMSINLAPLAQAFRHVVGASKDLVSIAGGGIAWFLNNIIGPLTKWQMEKLAPISLSLLTQAIRILNPILQSFGSSFAWLFENVLKPVGNWAGEKLIGALTDLHTWMWNLAHTIEDNRHIVDGITTTFLTVGGALLGLKTTFGFIMPLLKGLGLLFSFLSSPIGIIMLAITGLGIVLGVLSEEFGGMGPLMETIFTGLGEAWGNFITTLTEFWETTGQPFLDNLIQIWTDLSPMFSDILSTITDYWSKFVTAISDFWNTHGQTIMDAIIKIVTDVGEVFQEIMPVVQDIFSTVMQSISDFWNNTGKPIFDTFIDIIVFLGSNFMTLWNNFVKPVIDWIAEIITTLWNRAVKPMIGHVIDIIETLGAVFTGLWKNVFKPVVQFLIDTLGPIFKSVFTAVSSAVTLAVGVVSSVINGVVGVFKGVLNFITGIFFGDWDRAWKGIGQIFGGVWETIKGVFSSVWDFIVGTFSKGGKIFGGIVDGIANLFKGIINVLIKGINRLISTPFNVVNGLLNKIKNFSILGGKPFFGFWGYNPLPVPQIPQLAVGTNYVAKDGLAMIHEGEAVVPKKYNPALGGGFESDKEMVVILEEQNKLLQLILEKDSNTYLDTTKVSSELKKQEIRLRKQRGY